MICEICPKACELTEGQTGFCRARANINDRITCLNYGCITSMALDPIEKKPLARFMPGSYVLSVGSFGCNLRCPFCQNHHISMAGSDFPAMAFMSPEELSDKAVSLVKNGNIGLAYTYNEPLIGYEFLVDTATAIRDNGLKNIVVTNGLICEKPLVNLLPLLDAMNIDLKAYSGDFYNWVKGGKSAFETVIRTIELASSHCHTEVAALIIPGRNDSVHDMRLLAARLADIDRNIVLHVSRFHPDWKCLDIPPTPVKTVYELAAIAGEYLEHVFTGNI